MGAEGTVVDAVGIEHLLESRLDVEVGRDAGGQPLDYVRIAAVLQHGDLPLVLALQHPTNLRGQKKKRKRTKLSSEMSTLLRQERTVPMHVSKLRGGSFSIIITPTLVSRLVK